MKRSNSRWSALGISCETDRKMEQEEELSKESELYTRKYFQMFYSSCLRTHSVSTHARLLLHILVSQPFPLCSSFLHVVSFSVISLSFETCQDR